MNAELAFVLACCRWPHDSDALAELEVTAKAVSDWDRVEAIVGRNRVAPLVHHAIGRAQVGLPEGVATRLADRAKAAATRSLGMTRETIRLHQAFQAASLPMLVLKGVPLGVLAYGRIDMKESWDIDILVDASTIGPAMRLLEELGYQNSLSELATAQLQSIVDRSKEASFFHPDRQITTELHWGLADHPRLLHGMDVRSPSQQVAVPGGSLSTLADAEMFAFLCVHGSMHSWSRIKWLADLSAWFSGRSPAELQRLHAFAVKVGAGRSAALALSLCHRLLGLSLTEPMLSSLRQDRMVGALQANVLAILAYQGGGREHAHHSTAWLRTVTAMFFIAPGPRHALRQAGQFWNEPIDRRRLSLPPRLDFLYHFLRIPFWLWRQGWRIVGRSA